MSARYEKWENERIRLCKAIEAAKDRNDYQAAERLSRELLEHQNKEGWAQE